MDKTITTALMIVISMIMAVALFNAVYPAVLDSGNAISGMTRRTDERLQSQIEIIHAASELDSTGWWQDTNGNGDFDTFIRSTCSSARKVITPGFLPRAAPAAIPSGSAKSSMLTNGRLPPRCRLPSITVRRSLRAAIS